MNDTITTESTENADNDPAPQPGIGAKALALAGFAETALVEDPTTVISGHGGIFTIGV